MKNAKKVRRIRDRAYLLPSLVTVSSLFAGYLSIISSIKGNYDYSIKYILLASILDVLDGGVARKLNAASDFGREFDSLCDLVAFGVAPTILVWQWAFKVPFDEFGVLACFLFVAGGATRLARFNVTTVSEPKSYFVGLPIPAAAAALASIVYAFPEGVSDFGAILVLIYAVFLGGLMVSTFKFLSLKRLSVSKIDPRKLFLVLSLFVALIWKFDRMSVSLIMIGYIFFNMVPSFFRFGFRRKETASEEL